MQKYYVSKLSVSAKVGGRGIRRHRNMGLSVGDGENTVCFVHEPFSHSHLESGNGIGVDFWGHHIILESRTRMLLPRRYADYCAMAHVVPTPTLED